MRAKPTKEVAQAMVNLRVSADWSLVTKWMAAQGENWNQVLIDTSDHDTRAIAAGMVRAVNEVLRAIQSAPQILSELKK